MDPAVAGGQLQVTLTGADKEVQRLLLDAIQFTSGSGALQANFWRHVEINRHIRRKLAEHAVFQLAHQRNVHAASAALIRLGREIVTIAHDPGTAGQRRFDYVFNQLNARGIQHQQFSLIRHPLTVNALLDQVTELFRQRRAARLAREHDVTDTLLTQRGDHHIPGSGFTRPFQPFDDDKFTVHFFPSPQDATPEPHDYGWPD